MGAGDLPELAFDEEWRGIMVRARKEHGLSQDGLAKLVGSSQPLISKIESGLVGSSELVRPICDALSIPEPNNFANEDDRAWVQLGRLLRARNPEQYRRATSLVESMVDSEKATEVAPVATASKSK